MEFKDFIISFASLMSVTGYESYDADKLNSLVSDIFDESFTDAVGNRFLIKKCGRENAPKILVDAHMDEIGMVVTDIKENGFLKVANIGGVDTRILQASDVVVYGKEKIFGVVGSTPPHLQTPEDYKKLKEIGELVIDTGYTKEKISELVRVGTPVGFAPKYSELANGKLAGKGFDDKACAACAVEGIKRASKEEIAGDVYFMLSSREEGGAPGGASPGSFSLDPDYALVIDVDLGRTPDTPKTETVVMGGGVSLTFCPVTDRRLTKMTSELADKNGIKWQIAVSGRGTGTDTMNINLTRDGIPCVDVGLPLKSMHTSAEVLDMADAESAAELIKHFVCSKEIADAFGRA